MFDKKEYDKKYGKKWRQEHKEYIRNCKKRWDEEHPKYNKEWWNKFGNRYNEEKKRDRKLDPQKYLDRERRQREKHPERVRKNKREYKRKQLENPQFRLNNSMRTSIYQSLRGEKAGRKWETLLGYTLQDLAKHLEKLFDSKMNWNNYGSYWSIDHIKPQSLFKFEFSEDSGFRQCWALNNLRPLEAIENIKKGNKYEQN